MTDAEMAEMVTLFAELENANKELEAVQVDKRACLQLEALATERVNNIQSTVDERVKQMRWQAPPGTAWSRT